MQSILIKSDELAHVFLQTIRHGTLESLDCHKMSQLSACGTSRAHSYKEFANTFGCSCCLAHPESKSLKESVCKSSQIRKETIRQQRNGLSKKTSNKHQLASGNTFGFQVSPMMPTRQQAKVSLEKTLIKGHTAACLRFPGQRDWALSHLVAGTSGSWVCCPK